MIRLWAWLATRAATAWITVGAMGLLGGAWYLYDARGDEIAELKLELALCKGSASQAKVIERLAEKLNKQAQAKGDEEIKSIEDLPDECYYLDGPSPLNRVRDSER